RRHTRWPRDWSSDVCSSDLESREVIITRGIHARHLGGFTPDQRASGLSAALGDGRNDRRRNLVVELAGRVIIEEEQWLGALDDRSEERRAGKEGRPRKATTH